VSYPYSAHAVDLRKIVAAAGSKDKKLEAALKKKFADEYAENGEWFADEIAKGAPTLERAVSEIIAGTMPKKSKHGFQYGYALEKLVDHFGKRIDEDELGLGADEGIESYLKKAKQPTFEKLTKTGTFPIPIPAPADFPEISTMTPKDVVAALKSFTAIGKLIKAADDDDAEEIADALKSWCKKAASKKQALVLFAY
jgi:hypothetical protein